MFSKRVAGKMVVEDVWFLGLDAFDNDSVRPMRVRRDYFDLGWYATLSALIPFQLKILSEESANDQQVRHTPSVRVANGSSPWPALKRLSHTHTILAFLPW
jgi:hypothetical protein